MASAQWNGSKAAKFPGAPRARGLLAIAALLAVLSLLVLLAIACGGGGSTASPTPRPDPEQTLRDLVDALNRGDYQAFYNGLSADRRQSTSYQDFQKALDTVRTLVGRVPKLDVTTVSNKVVNGDSATADVSINIELGSSGIPVQDTASFVWEDGRWHLADHFIDTALTTIGIGVGTPAPSPSPSPTG